GLFPGARPAPFFGGVWGGGGLVGGGPPPPPKAERTGAPDKPGVGLAGWRARQFASGHSNSGLAITRRGTAIHRRAVKLNEARKRVTPCRKTTETTPPVFA